VAEAIKKELDPMVVSRLAHVLWRIENAAAIKNATREQRIASWNREKLPHLEKARKIVRMADTVEFIAKPEQPTD
jgi:hypothetical protein